MARYKIIDDDGILFYYPHSCAMAAHIPGKAILCNYS